jgi:hypothetical protein
MGFAKYITLAVFVVVLLFPATSSAAELLAQYSATTGGGSGFGGTYDKARIFPRYEDFRMGKSVAPYWRAGDSGSFDFTASNSENFAQFVSELTDGQDDLLGQEFELGDPPGPGGWELMRESKLLNRTPDLFGYEVTAVRLLVHDVRMRNDPNWFRFEADITWEYWGRVPEPSSCILVCWGCLLLAHSRRGAFFNHTN